MPSRLVSRRWVLGAAAAGAAVSLVAPAGRRVPAWAGAAERLSLPMPTGPERLGTVALHLVDRARVDPWAPTRPVREVMVQVWYPARRFGDQPAAAWLTRNALLHFEQGLGLPAGLLRWPDTHARAGAPVRGVHGGWPVLIYSHALSLNRALGTVLVEELASHGYVVVTIDHTHDAGAVEFPDGRVEPGLAEGPDEAEVLARALPIRTADTRFVLGQLAALNVGRNPDAGSRPLPPGLCGALDLSRVGMFGHSLGGATAAATMADDSRVRAGVNMDGSMPGNAAAGSRRPFLLVGASARPVDPSWERFWINQRGWKRELRLAGSTHATFSDFIALYPQIAAVVGQSPEDVAAAVGTLDPVRSLTVQRIHLRAFFDLHLRHGDARLFNGTVPEYPEIQILR
jgi:hypothetical protein